MRHTPSSRLVTAVLAAVALAGLSIAGQVERKVQPRPILIIGGTLLDGSGRPAEHNGAILISDGRIKSIGLSGSHRAPKDAREIDATGKWILPGLIDADVHLFQTSGLDARPDRLAVPGARPYRQVLDDIRRNPAPYLRAYVCSGVTGIVDLGGPGWLFDLRDSRRDDALSPRIAFAGPMLATVVPAALEVDGEPFWPMKSEADVRADVRRLADRKADVVSIEWAPGSNAEAERRLLSAAIDAAHAAKLRVAVRAQLLETARIAIDAGADVLVGGITDARADDEVVRSLVRRKVVYVPALVSLLDEASIAKRSATFDSIERECAPPSVLESLARLDALPQPPAADAARDEGTLSIAQANLKRIADAGGVVAAGTGAGNVRTLHGPSLHRELALMVAAGLSPLQALVAATSGGATVMGRPEEVGRIAAGREGDVVILDADPLTDIRNTRRISTVIRGGAIYER